MSNDGVNKGRRRLLVGATSVLGAVGAVGVAVPFVASWHPSARARAAGAPARADISRLEPGQQMTVEWRGRPIWVVHRTDEMLASLNDVEHLVRDPQSTATSAGQQPEYARNQHRSRDPRYLVVIGICTHLGCSPTYRPEVAPADLGSNWFGGFFCPCHSSRFDLAGRVYSNQPAPTSLEVPPHSYLDEHTIIVGVDEENT